MPLFRKPSGFILASAPPGGGTGGGAMGGILSIILTWACPGSSQKTEAARINGSRTMEARRAFHDIGVILPASLVAATAAMPWKWLQRDSLIACREMASAISLILDDSARIGVVSSTNGEDDNPRRN